VPFYCDKCKSDPLLAAPGICPFAIEHQTSNIASEQLIDWIDKGIRFSDCIKRFGLKIPDWQKGILKLPKKKRPAPKALKKVLPKKFNVTKNHSAKFDGEPVTHMQLRILTAIEEFWLQNKYGPVQRELSRLGGMSRGSALFEQLRVLRERGLIIQTMVEGRSIQRTLRTRRTNVTVEITW